MKKWIDRFQKDFASIQELVQKEGLDLVQRVAKLAEKPSLMEKRAELEKLVEKKLTTLGPAYEKFLEKMRDNAERAGIDIEKLEEKLRIKTPKEAPKKTATQKPKSEPKATKKTKATSANSSKEDNAASSKKTKATVKKAPAKKAKKA